MSEQQEETVSLEPKKFGDILSLSLTIPEYQRTYCWEDKQVNTLLDDLRDFFNEKQGDKDVYVMSTVILHKRQQDDKEVYDIVDGQQRLITLALILYGISSKQGNEDFKCCNLLNANFGDQKKNSEENEQQNLSLPAQHVIHNMQLIKKRLPSLNLEIDKILDSIEFSVITLTGDNLDLAYTFFSHNNNRGKPLTDYDLLKANHLRYLTSPSTQKQAAYVAQRWEQMIIEEESLRRDYKPENSQNSAVTPHSYLAFDCESTTNVDFSLPYVRVMDLYLFRLRRWIRQESSWDQKNPLTRRIKDEFMPAPILGELPPFGEQFHFEECIQGGAHFFGYIDYFFDKFSSFRKTNAFEYIHAISANVITHEKSRYNFRYHDFYRNVMEAHLFAYYLKFHNSYLSEAALLISRVIAHMRFTDKKANADNIHSKEIHFKLLTLLQRSTSPTFYLGWLKKHIELELLPQEDIEDIKDSYVRKDFKDCMSNAIEKLKLLQISTIENFFKESLNITESQKS